MQHYAPTLQTFVYLTLVLGSSAWAGPPGQSKKLIEFGWDEPDTAFMRRHVDQLLKSPFDGCVFEIKYRDAEGKTGSFLWSCWGKRAFRHEDFTEAVADLKATVFGRFSYNFLRFNVTPGDVDWFDSFDAILNNAKLAASIAHEGGARGLLFDIEQYNAPLFNYARQKYQSSKSWDEYSRQVRERGRQVMTAFQEGFPDLELFMTFSYSLPWASTQGLKTPLQDSKYGLLAPLIDGLVDAIKGRTRIIEGNESAYWYREARQFQNASRRNHEDLLALVAEPDKYLHHVSMSHGIWMDCVKRPATWDPQDVAKNAITPEIFETVVNAAIENCDQYVWIYTEAPRWWTEAGKPDKVPDAYEAVLRRARANLLATQPATRYSDADSPR